MPITVDYLLQLAFPAGTRVVAGREGLQREVTWARSLRPRPPAFEALEGGELALVSSAHLGFLEESVTLAYLLNRLADVDVAAVAVLGAVGEDAVEVADARGVPLLQLPPGVSLTELERSAIGAIVDQQAEMQRRATDIYRQLSQLTMEERGLQGVVDGLAEITGKAVALEDEHFRLQYGAAGQQLPSLEGLTFREARGEILEWVRTVPLSSTQPPVARFLLAEGSLGRFVAPISARDGVVGFLSIIGPADFLTELDGIIASRAAAVCAVEVAKEAAVGEAEARMRGDLLDQLLSVGLDGGQVALGKAKRLGYDPSLPSIVLAFKASAPERRGGVTTMLDIDRARRKLESVLRAEMARRESKSLVASRGSIVVAVVPSQSSLLDRGAREMAESIRAGIESMLEHYFVAVGIGRSTQEGRALGASFREAERALAIGTKVNGPSSSTAFDDLGIMRLLAQVSSSSDLDQFHEEMLGKLEEHDRRGGGELTRTLEAFFRCLGNLTRTADYLSLHRNSLLYRLQRIEEITGHDMDDAEVRLSLQVALKVRQLLEAEKTRGSQ